ncbi:MAG: glutamyl-tRNA amidotransferase [Bacilli bacterium]|nr:glutamyl-tRNA amidotransferase [Bacilli bacterium]
MKTNLNKFRDRLGEKGLKRFKKVSFAIMLCAICGTSTVVLAADDPLSVVNNLSNFIFGLIRAVGMIILGFSIVQIGLSIKSHDPSQRANGFLTLAGGIVITFAKEILGMITGG